MLRPQATNRRMSRTNSSARNFELNPALGGGPNVRFGVICGRTAKPCGPGTRCWCQAGEMLRSQPGFARSSICRRRRQEEFVSGERAVYAVNPLRRECRDARICMLVCALLAHYCTRDRGCSKHPAFPAPSDFWGEGFLQTSGETRRENENPYSLVVTRQRVGRMAAR